MTPEEIQFVFSTIYIAGVFICLISCIVLLVMEKDQTSDAMFHFTPLWPLALIVYASMMSVRFLNKKLKRINYE
jgi:hypothetical protein